MDSVQKLTNHFDYADASVSDLLPNTVILNIFFGRNNRCGSIKYSIKNFKFYINKSLWPVKSHYKTCLLGISVSLAVTFNARVKAGYFPDFLKTAKFTPVFKKGNKHLTQNYRHISMIRIFSKIL